MKWVVFLVFLMLEPSFEAIMDIVPFGLLALLVVKGMIVLPENPLATFIYRKISKQLEKMEFEQYNSQLSRVVSWGCQLISVRAIKAAEKLAVYVKSEELEEVYQEIDTTLKIIEYKRMSVNAKHKITRSENRLDDTTTEVDPEELREEEEIVY